MTTENTKTTKKKVTKKKTARKTSAAADGDMTYIAIDNLHPDPEQPRKHFNQQALDDLAADITERGILQPLLIRDYVTDDEDRDGEYLIVAGERRFRAAKKAGLNELPVYIDNSANDQPLDRLMAQVAENFSREDLNPIELAHFFNQLVEKHEYRVNQIPNLLKEKGLAAISRGYVSNHMRLIRLPDWAQQYIIDGKISQRHGLALLPALHSEAVLSKLKENIDECLEREAKFDDEPFTVAAAEDVVQDLYRDHHIWLDLNFGDDAVLYKWDEKKDGEALGIVKVANHYFATNHDEHERRQAEAKQRIEANKQRQQQRQSSSAGNSQSAGGTGNTGQQEEPIKRPAHEKLHAYLFNPVTSSNHPEGGWLRRHILQLFDNLGEITLEQQDDIRIRLAQWLTLDCPEPGYSLQAEHVGSDNGPVNRMDVAAYAGILNISDALTASPDTGTITQIIDNQARNAVRFMSSDNLVLLAHHMQVNLDAAWRVDEDYLSLYTGPALDEIAEQHADSIPMQVYLGCKKVGDKRQFLIDNKEHIGVTADIRQLWEEELDQAQAGIKEQQQDIAEQQQDSEEQAA